MSNIEKYRKVFCDSLEIDEDVLDGLVYQGIPEWDSVGHMYLISTLEEAFDVTLEAEDILDFSSFERGKEILGKNYGVSFE